MKIRSKKATRIAVPLFVKFILEARKLGYDDFGYNSLRDISRLDRTSAHEDWQKLKVLYEAFLTKLKQEFKANNVWSWLYVGKEGIEFADLRKALNDFFCPADKGITIKKVDGLWTMVVRDASVKSKTATTLDKVAKEYGKNFETLFMEALRNYQPEIVSPDMIRLNYFLEVKKAIYNGYLFFHLGEEVSRWGCLIGAPHRYSHLVDKVIFMERYKSLEKITF